MGAFNALSLVAIIAVFGEFLAGLPLPPSSTITSSSLSNSALAYSSSNSKALLSDYSNKFSTVARVANGISLVAGLMNGNVPIDDVIGELLHFGDVKVAEILGLEKDKIDAVVSKLQTFQLDGSAKVKSLEDFTLGMVGLRDAYVNMTDKELNSSSEYFAEIDRFRNDANIFSVYTTAEKSSRTAVEKIIELKSISQVTPATLRTTTLVILTASNELGNIGNITGSFTQTVQNLDRYQELSSLDFLKSTKQTMDILAIHRNLPTSFLSDAPEIGKNIDPVISLSAVFDAAKSGLASIRNFVSKLVHVAPSRLQYTSGFSNGAPDLKKLVQDVVDPSLEQTLGNGKQFARLSAGLKALMTISGKLDILESKLSPVSKNEVLHSANKALELQELLSGLNVASSDAVSVAKMMLTNPFTKFELSRLAAVINVLEKAEDLKKGIAKRTVLFETFPGSPQEMAEVVTLLGKVNASTAPLAEVESFLTEFHSKISQVEKVLTYLKIVQSTLDLTSLQNMAGEILGNQTSMNSVLSDVKTLSFAQLDKIKSATEPVDRVTNAIRASKIIKNSKDGIVTNLKLVVTTITQASETINDLQTIPAAMKKEQSADVQDMIAMKDSGQTSAALGAAAGSVHNMERLQSMETAIQDLEQSGDSVFMAELASLQDLTKRNKMQRMWGDHSEFLAALNSSLRQIQQFSSNLSLAAVNDLRQLGGPLESAKSVGDVAGSASEKSEAVSTLIQESTNQNNRRELESIKTNLDKLAALDLNFSSHHSAYPQVAPSLTSLFSFLDGFLTVPSGSGSGSGPVGTNAGAPGASNVHIVSADFSKYVPHLLVGVLLLGLVAAAVYLLYCYHKDKKKSWKEIQRWINKVYFSKFTEAEAFSRSLLTELKEFKDDQKFMEVDKTRSRYNNTKLLKNTAVELPDGTFIHANWIKARSGCRFIATQGPLDGTEGTGKVDTRGTLLYMIMQFETEFVVQLCNFEEEKEPNHVKYARLKAEKEADEKDAGKTDADSMEEKRKRVNGREAARLKRMKAKSARYYGSGENETMKFEKYTVTTMKLEFLNNGQVEKRTLKVEESEENKAHIFTHLFHKRWEDGGVPEHSLPVVTMMETVNKSKAPVVVHCSTGVGRTASFIASEVIARDVERHPNKKTSEMFVELRKSRHGGIQSASQAFFSVVCAVGLLVNEYSPDSAALFNKHEDVFEGVREQLTANELKDDWRIHEEKGKAETNDVADEDE